LHPPLLKIDESDWASNNSNKSKKSYEDAFSVELGNNDNSVPQKISMLYYSLYYKYDNNDLMLSLPYSNIMKEVLFCNKLI
jgi:hypothetical protein